MHTRGPSAATATACLPDPLSLVLVVVVSVLVLAAAADAGGVTKLPNTNQVPDYAQKYWLGSFSSLSADGSSVALGSCQFDESGLYVADWRGGTWTSTELRSDVRFLESHTFDPVQLSADATVLAVGCTECSALLLYRRAANNTWGAPQDLSPPSGESGAAGIALGMSRDGTLVVTSGRMGQLVKTARADTITGTWHFMSTGNSTLRAPCAMHECSFGRSLSLSLDGPSYTLAVGVPKLDVFLDHSYYQGTVELYSSSSGSWSKITTITPSDRTNTSFFGESVALSAAGTRLAVSSPRYGGSWSSIYIYVADDTRSKWRETRRALSGFGYTERLGYGWPRMPVAISGDGSTVIVASSEAQTICFLHTQDDGASWNAATLTGSETLGRWFGASVSISEDGRAVAVGSPSDTGKPPSAVFVINACDAGETISLSTGKCTMCAAGRLCSTGFAASKCPRGAYCPRGTASAALCPAGTFNSEVGASSVNACHDCPAGHFCEAGSTSPSPCPAGSFNAQTKMGSCEPCPPGTSSNEGATSCSKTASSNSSSSKLFLVGGLAAGGAFLVAGLCYYAKRKRTPTNSYMEMHDGDHGFGTDGPLLVSS